VGLTDSRYGPGTGCCDQGHESLSFLKGGEFLVQLSDYQLLKMDFVPWSWLIDNMAVALLLTFGLVSFKKSQQYER
jgi:hypothetical protein